MRSGGLDCLDKIPAPVKDTQTGRAGGCSEVIGKGSLGHGTQIMRAGDQDNRADDDAASKLPQHQSWLGVCEPL